MAFQELSPRIDVAATCVAMQMNRARGIESGCVY